MKIFKTLVHVICVSLILHFPLMTYAQTPINKKMNSGLELDVKSAMQLASQIINTVPSVQVFLKLVEPAIGEKSVEILKNHLLGLQLDLSKPFLKTELQADGSVLVGDQKDQLKLMPNLEVQLGAQKAKWRSVQSRGLQENLKSLTEFLKSDLKGHKQSFYRAMPRFLLGEKAQALTLSKSDIKYGSNINKCVR